MFNRNFLLLILSGIILGAPMPMLILLGGLAGIKLAPYESLATLAPSIQIFAGVLIATPISIFMSKYGRRNGFLVGCGLIILGGILGAMALLQTSFIILNLGHFCLGAGIICFGYMRFAAAEAVEEKHKPTAMSLTLTSGLVATFVAAEIFSLTKDSLSNAPLAGAYLAISALGIIGCLPVLALRLTTEQPANQPQKNLQADKVNILKTITRLPVATAIIAAAVAATAMTFMMVPTPLAMLGMGHTENHAASVINWHLIAMFAPSFFTGWLIQKFGEASIIITGMLLIAVGAVCTLYNIELMGFYLALILLGIGWNFGFIGGSSLLQKSLTITERGKIQGINDTLIALSSTFASLLAGIIIANLGWASIAIMVLPLIGFAIIFTLRLKSKPNLNV
uniref:MFS transporter n=1 Tax=OCS116 cluster bacterium TaxID=2030921 RepID=A0A2A4YUY7_9PROT